MIETNFDLREVLDLIDILRTYNREQLINILDNRFFLENSDAFKFLERELMNKEIKL